MLARKRQEELLAELRRSGSVRVRDLVEQFGVSEMTVRRDLDELATLGLLEKVHGGAIRRQDPATHEPGFEAKSGRAMREKRAIAEQALRLVVPGAAIALTAGTTTFALAELLVEVPALTVVTNSVRVADVLHTRGRDSATVVLIGGVRTPSDALVGPIAVAALRSLHVETLFMGVHGIHEEAGFTSPNLLEAETNQAFLRAAQRRVVLADSTKWGVQGLSTITTLDGADSVIIDDGVEASAVALLRRHAELVVVKSGRPVKLAVVKAAPARASVP